MATYCQVWRDSLHVTCGLTACTPGSAPGPTLGNEYGKTLPFLPEHKSQDKHKKVQKCLDACPGPVQGYNYNNLCKVTLITIFKKSQVPKTDNQPKVGKIFSSFSVLIFQ